MWYITKHKDNFNSYYNFQLMISLIFQNIWNAIKIYHNLLYDLQ